MADAARLLESGLREKIIEHVFIGHLLRCLWRQGSRDIEVLDRAPEANSGSRRGHPVRRPGEDEGAIAKEGPPRWAAPWLTDLATV